MKLSDVLNFPEFYHKVETSEIPATLAYKIAKVASTVEESLTFYRAQLQRIIDSYGEKDENGQVKQNENGIVLREGMTDECAAKLQELQDVEVDIQPFLHIEDLTSLNMSPAMMHNLMPFMVD